MFDYQYKTWNLRKIAEKQKGYVEDIEKIARENTDFRRVLFTSKHNQLVVMSLKPEEDIGNEVHKVDQFFRIEEGSGEVVIEGNKQSIKPGSVMVIPAGVHHNIINTSNDFLKLYTIYSPPNHRLDTLHKTKDEALADKEHFDGKTNV